MYIDYVIIDNSGKPTKFNNGDIVLYGDIEDALIDFIFDSKYGDKDLLKIESTHNVNGIATAKVSSANSFVEYGIFNFDDEIDGGFQIGLRCFISGHLF